MEPKISAPDRKSGYYKTFAHSLSVFGGLSLFLCVFAYAFFFRSEAIGHTNEWGAFGDFVGGLAGTLIALITLIAIARTLSLQASELEATRDLLQEQASTLHRQALEATFFRMLELFDKTSAVVHAGKVPWHLESQFETKLTDLGYPHQRDLQTYKSAYADIYGNHERQLGPYFRAFYHVISLVDKADLTEVDKARYTSIARARLASDELRLHFINAAFGREGSTGMRPLIERYGLLKHAKSLPFPSYLEPLKFTVLESSAYASYAERTAASNSAGESASSG